VNTTAVVNPSVTVGSLKVVVEGTTISDLLDANGNFRLVNVPSGNIKLRFTGTGVDAQLALNGVGLQQHLNLKVQVQAAAAQIVAEERSDLADFDSAVASVDRSQKAVHLTDGTTVRVDDDTWWDTGGDVFSYEALADAVEGGSPAKVEGVGTAEAGGFILATVIKAEVDDAEFEAVVASVDEPSQTLTLVDGTIVEIGTDTIWDVAGDITDFATLADLVQAGNEVKVEGEGTRQSDGSILATTIKAEVEAVEFKGLAASVAGSQSLTLNDGTVVAVNADTDWHPSGNLFSLAEIAAALAAAGVVEIEGEGYYQLDGSILATKIKAKLDDGGDDKPWIDYTAEIALLQELIDRINALALEGAFDGVNLNSLLSTLSNAVKDLEKGNGNPAVGKLGAFINKIEALVKTGSLSSGIGDELIAKAQEIITAIRSKS
jgi:hypothetical protein